MSILKPMTFALRERLKKQNEFGQPLLENFLNRKVFK